MSSDRFRDESRKRKPATCCSLVRLTDACICSDIWLLQCADIPRDETLLNTTTSSEARPLGAQRNICFVAAAVRRLTHIAGRTSCDRICYVLLRDVRETYTSAFRYPPIKSPAVDSHAHVRYTHYKDVSNIANSPLSTPIVSQSTLL